MVSASEVEGFYLGRLLVEDLSLAEELLLLADLMVELLQMLRLLFEADNFLL